MSRNETKRQKAKARRKDYLHKKHLLANLPTIAHSYKKPILGQEVDKKTGKITIVKVGEKEKIFKSKVKSGIFFPKQRKYA